MEWDWFCRRCFKDGELFNPLTGQSAVYETVEKSLPGVYFDVYSNNYPSRESGWGTHDYRVLLSVDMIKTLTMADTVEDMAEEAAERQKTLTERINNAVQGMEDVAGRYEGSLEKLRFGVQLWDDGTATYHANYVNREGVGEITAESADELLELMRAKG